MASVENILNKRLMSLVTIFGLFMSRSLHIFVGEMDWPLSASVKDGATYDFIIVGGGTAGCVLASKLSENGNWSVLLIEAGGNPPVHSSIPSLASTIVGSQWDWNYEAKKTNIINDASMIHWAAGKMLGGSSSLNLMYYNKGSTADYDSWAEMGNKGWSWEDVKPYFKEFENLNPITIEQKPTLAEVFGTKGRFKLGKINWPFNEFNEKFKQAYSEIGIKVNKDYFPANNSLGVGEILASIDNGRRVSTATAFILPAIDRSNLHIVKNTIVEKVLITNNKALGVQIIDGRKFYANKEVILSAGTFGTAKLLMLSGVGQRKELSKLNIETKIDRKVSYTFSDQLMVPIHFYADAQSNVLDTQLNIAKEVVNYLDNKTGLFASSLVSNLITFFSLKNKNKADFEIAHLYSPIGSELSTLPCILNYKFNLETCIKIAQLNLRHDVVVLHIELLHPKSRGIIKLKSNNPYDAPLIEARFFDKTEDLVKMAKGISIVNDLLKTDAFKAMNMKLIPIKISNCLDFKIESFKYWKCIALDRVLTFHHPIGSAKMAVKSDEDAVVDNELRVYGVDNLRIGDASVMPSQISGHTASAVVMIAHKLADLIKQRFT